ncbi:MAG: lipoprotein [Woeseiaceae bacterium]|nr:lipoprotein [Woeseiaceae bacterium]
MTFLLRLITVVVLLVSFAACGQSGPLYLPGNPSSVQAPPADSAAEAGDEEETDEQDEY